MMPARHHRGRPPRLDSTLKIIRDKTAFHYDRLNLTEAADNLAAGENSLYLAQHPANSLYYMGSALVFRAVFAVIADRADGAANGSHEARVHKGAQIALGEPMWFGRASAVTEVTCQRCDSS